MGVSILSLIEIVYFISIRLGFNLSQRRKPVLENPDDDVDDILLRQNIKKLNKEIFKLKSEISQISLRV